ncbi:MAG: methyl-accepting chemotaxis protein [Gemmatimonadales bacterium]|nr:methyl-accepting chemotaxis protein [Gemmatimonadales bacterium]
MHTTKAPSTSSLSRRLVIWTGVALLLLLAAVAWFGRRTIRERVLREADTGILQAAEQASLVIDRVVAEREGQVRLLASLPSVVDAARLGSTRAAALGLPNDSLEEAERRFDSTRTLDVDPRTRRFLRERGVSLDLAEVLVTDSHGYNAITTERTSDFVQSDEEWWRQAFSSGLSPASASFDESAGRVTISVASAVREGDSAAAAGVMKVVYGLGALQSALSAAATRGVVSVDLIDGEGRVIASSAGSADLKFFLGHPHLPKGEVDAVVRYDDGVAQRASIRSTNRSMWRVVAHTPEALPLGEISAATTALWATAFIVFVALSGALWAMNAFVTRRIAAPAARLAAAAESVAAGDLSIRLPESTVDDEIGRLGRATSEMIRGLRTLTVAIKDSAEETTSMAMDLTASSEGISASSQQMAQTSADLSRQSADMAQTITDMAGNSARLSALSASLTTGASDGVTRNQQLRVLAQENRSLLNTSVRQLEALQAEARKSAVAGESVARASEEIREFVYLVQNIARQSKLLAFSAGMEASRAGQQGAGFTVVAKEVERLAISSAEAAERAEKVVSSLLDKVAESRDSSAQSAAAVDRVRHATQRGVESFGHVEAAVADAEKWTVAIEQASLTTNEVVENTTQRLDALARGTEAFAAAMQEVAASAEEQSASTEEIAATAAALAATAERLSTQAGAFRLGRGS